jgi:hypothetical protein
MFKALYDRLAYALLGATFGAVLAVILWILYDVGFSSRLNAPEIHAGLQTWVRYVGGFFGVIGFLFKAGAAGVGGGALNEIQELESQRSRGIEIPMWLAVPVLVAVAVAVGYFLRD